MNKIVLDGAQNMHGRNKKLYGIWIGKYHGNSPFEGRKTEDFRSDLSRDISNMFWHYSLFSYSVKTQKYADLYMLLLSD
jgi:hypothetical protein